MSSKVAFWQANFILCLVSIVSAKCYRPDGSAVDSTYQPCNGSTAVSMCCHLGFTNNGGDACGSGSSYGLCGITGTQLWRESCTDPTWKSSSCLKLCIDGDNSATDAMITACPDGSYCCGQNNATCCTLGHGLFIVNNEVSNTSIALSLPTSSATYPALTPISPVSIMSSSSNTPVSVSAGPLATDTGGFSTSAKIGLGVSILVGVIAAALLAVLVFWKRIQRRKNLQTVVEVNGTGIDGSSITGTVPDEYYNVALKSNETTELGDTELDAGQNVFAKELHAQDRRIAELP